MAQSVLRALYGAAPFPSGIMACAARLNALVRSHDAAWDQPANSRRCASSSVPPAGDDRQRGDAAESQAGPSTSGGDGAPVAAPLRPAPKSLSEALQAATAPIVKGHLTAVPWEGDAAPTPSAGPESNDSSAPSSHGVLLPELTGGTGDAFRAAAVPNAGPGGAPGGGPTTNSLWHPRYGYAALGGVDPEASRKAAARSGAEPGSGSRIRDLLAGLSAPQPRIHPQRKFLPGQVYEPQDLNPFAAPLSRRTRRAEAPQRLRPRDVEELADYKNVLFLSKLLSPAGRLLPRKQTKLPVSLHRLACRQIKLARTMGLMAGEARLDKLHLAREREREVRELQEKRYGAIGGVPMMQQAQQQQQQQFL